MARANAHDERRAVRRLAPLINWLVYNRDRVRAPRIRRAKRALCGPGGLTFKSYTSVVEEGIARDFSMGPKWGPGMKRHLPLGLRRRGRFSPEDFARALELADRLLFGSLTIEGAGVSGENAVRELQAVAPGISKKLCHWLIGRAEMINH